MKNKIKHFTHIITFLVASTLTLQLACATETRPVNLPAEEPPSAVAVVEDEATLPVDEPLDEDPVPDAEPEPEEVPPEEVVEAPPEPVPEPEPPAACSYCGSTEHTQSKCALHSVEQRGAVGRWVIPSVGVDVACFSYVLGVDDGDYGQAIGDAPDSAAYSAYGSQYLIADHNYQGFSAIEYCSVGTKAYMNVGTSRTEYVCTGIEYGHNTSTTITDDKYNDIAYGNSGGVTLYTCRNGWQNIVIVYFTPA